MAKLNIDLLVKVFGKGEIDSLSSKLKHTGTTLTTFVTLPLLAAGAGLISMAADAEKTEAKVQSVFDSMGAAAWTTVDALDASAQALARATTFDDDAIKEAQAVLLTFGKVTGKQFDIATEAALNMSTVLGTDLQSATIQIGKALNDPIAGLTALTRSGIQFTDQQKKQIKAMVEAGDTIGAQGIILAELDRQFGDAATNMAETSGGKMTQALNKLGEAGESMGAILLPVLVVLATVISGVADAFLSLDPGIQTFIIGILAVVAAIGPLMLIAGQFIGAFGLMKTAILNIPTAMGFVDLALSKTGAAFNALKLLLLSNPFIALAAAVIAIAALIILNWDKIVAVFKVVWKVISQGFAKLGDALSGVWKSITQMASAAWNGLGKIIKGAINIVIGVINGFIGFVNGIQIHIPEIGVGPVHSPAFDWWGLQIKKIPKLAEGGIVNEATLAILGERRPEAVIPLDRLQQLQPNIVNVYLTVEGDLTAKTPEEVVEAVQRATRFGFSRQLQGAGPG